MFRTVPLSIMRSFSLYTQQWYCHTGLLTACEQDQDAACSQAVNQPVWHIPLLCVKWKTPDDGQRNSPKRVEFYSKNKFEKLVHLVGFIIRIFSRCSSPGGQILLLSSHSFRFCKFFDSHTIPPHLLRKRLILFFFNRLSIIPWRVCRTSCENTNNAVFFSCLPT
jgi:hypothetical protein